MKKKILFIVSSLKVGGGAEKSVTLLAKGLSEYYDVELLTFYDFQHEYPYDGKRASFGYAYSSFALTKLFRFFFLFPMRLKSFLQQNNYDLVVSNAEDANLITLVTKKYYFDFPLWCVIRSNVFSKDNPYYRFSGLHKYADKLVVLTKELQRLTPYPSTVIANALDLSNLEELKSEEVEEKSLFEKKTIIMVGRLSKAKNHKWFFDVFKELTDVNLVLLGSGDLEAELIEYAKDIPNIHFLGVKKNVYAYLAKADVFVLPSIYEGMPRALMEALACGCVCVANDCKTGPRELLGVDLDEKITTYKKTKYGYLVPFDNKQEFIRALQDALYNSKNIKPDNRFSLNKIITKWRHEIEKKR